MEPVNDFRTTLISRHVMIMGKRTSVRLDKKMWAALKEAAKLERCKTNDLCTLIYMKKNARETLSSAVRQFLVLYYKAASTEEGHRKAGHGSLARMLTRAQLSDEDQAEFMKHCSVDRSLCHACCMKEKCHRGKKDS